MAKRKDAKREAAVSSRSSRRRLGRGLSSLMSSPVPVTTDDPADTMASTPATSTGQSENPGDALTQPSPDPGVTPETNADEYEGMVQLVSIDHIQPNHHQPRQQFDEAGLESLATSIRSAGVMQPIMLRPSDSDIDICRYNLIAGERRWRAAKLAGLKHIPAIVRRIDDATAAEWALVENIQREDLNPIERAEAFRRLCDDFALTHQDIAERVGLNRSSVSNLLRLLDLDPETIDEVRNGQLTLGHARALLAIEHVDTRRRLARQAAQQGWSVRALERRINAHVSAAEETSRGAADATPTDIHLRHLADELGQHLGTRVRIEAGRTKGTGRLIVDFYSLDEFESLLERLGYKSV